ncbi:MAG: hypothetical protein KAW92_08735 [Candidatus Cloacimonetes bacterium]|nr:hypothetical protein [Candidatus Cloacimonadota bacterium]
MKNIKIEKNFSIQEGSFVYTDFFENTSEKVALVFQTSEKSLISEKAMTLLVQVFKEYFYQYDYEIKERLRKTVVEMHWRLAAFFKRENHKFEISTVILIIKNDIVYAIQLGRLVIMSYSDEFEYIGFDINKIYAENYQLPILGIKEEEIQIKTYSEKIIKDTNIVVLPAKLSNEFDKNISIKSDFEKKISQLIESDEKPILKIGISEGSGRLQYKKKFRITTKGSAIVLVIVIIIASFYVFFGKKWWQGAISSGKEFVNEKKRLIIDYSALLPKIPQPKFDEDWEWTAPSNITINPTFDSDNIYLICNKIITCIRKNSHQVKWRESFQYPLISTKLLRNEKILLIDELGFQYLIEKAKGHILWKREYPILIHKKEIQSPEMITIDYIRDGRLEQNYYITVTGNVISIISGKNGKTVAQKEFQQKIDFISEYDYVEKCFYLSFVKRILKINLVLG